MKTRKWLLLGVVLIAFSDKSVFAGDSLLRLAQRASVARGVNATEKQRDLEQKVHSAEDRLRQNAVGLAQNAADLEEKGRQALMQDLIDGKAAIVQELKCSIDNIKNNTNVSGTIQINKNDGGAQRAVINLANLFAGDPSRQSLGLGFSSFAEDGKTIRFDLIDLSNGSIVKTGTIAELGLSDITSSCDLSKRVVSLQDGVVQVDAQSLEKKLISHTEQLVKDEIQKAKEAN